MPNPFQSQEPSPNLSAGAEYVTPSQDNQRPGWLLEDMARQRRLAVWRERSFGQAASTSDPRNNNMMTGKLANLTPPASPAAIEAEFNSDTPAVMAPTNEQLAARRYRETLLTNEDQMRLKVKHYQELRDQELDGTEWGGTAERINTLRSRDNELMNRMQFMTQKDWNALGDGERAKYMLHFRGRDAIGDFDWDEDRAKFDELDSGYRLDRLNGVFDSRDQAAQLGLGNAAQRYLELIEQGRDFQSANHPYFGDWSLSDMIQGMYDAHMDPDPPGTPDLFGATPESMGEYYNLAWDIMFSSNFDQLTPEEHALYEEYRAAFDDDALAGFANQNWDQLMNMMGQYGMGDYIMTQEDFAPYANGVAP